jgi:transcriptional regulator with XRE-family HTH domain
MENTKGGEQQMAARDLRIIRQDKKITKATVSKVLDVHRDTVTAIEEGKSDLKAQHISKLAELYNIDESDLLNLYCR